MFYMLVISYPLAENCSSYSNVKKYDKILLEDAPQKCPSICISFFADVQLQSHHSNDYLQKGPNNLSLDIPPGLGDHDVAIVEIAKNDGAEGIVEFPSYLKVVEVDEKNGSVIVPIVSSCFELVKAGPPNVVFR